MTDEDLNPICLLTKHNKQIALSAPLRNVGYKVQTFDQYDTDQLGTFTGEIPRAGTQLDAARTKALLACELSGLRFGLGSEGSFGPDPYLGVSSWNIEVLVWRDAQEDYDIHAVYQGPDTNYAQTFASTEADVTNFAAKTGFPEHGLVIGKPGEPWFRKDLTNVSELLQTVRAPLSLGPVWLETDMRAHRNRRRMTAIARCAEMLAQKIASKCPACAKPGFGITKLIPGARCENCGRKTSTPCAQLFSCATCGETLEQQISATVNAMRCDHCNP
ncbi:MAG TPA: DUF6671 family protein [Burkholderiaceae bacterium]|jgi:hypothetical protein